MSLAFRLNELRVNKRKSLQEVADALSSSKTHIWELEKGRSTNPSLELLTNISTYFKVSICYLVGESFENAQQDELARMFRQVGRLKDSDRAILDDMIRSLQSHRKLEHGEDRP